MNKAYLKLLKEESNILQERIGLNPIKLVRKYNQIMKTIKMSGGTIQPARLEKLKKAAKGIKWAFRAQIGTTIVATTGGMYAVKKMKRK